MKELISIVNDARSEVKVRWCEAILTLFYCETNGKSQYYGSRKGLEFSVIRSDVHADQFYGQRWRLVVTVV
jgi:hypothetical protein